MSYCPYCGEKIVPSELRDNQCPKCGAYLDIEPLTTTPPPPPPPSTVKKPGRMIGVSIVAIITIFEGLLFLGIGGLLTLGAVFFLMLGGEEVWILWFSLWLLLLGIILIGVGGGLWSFRSWVWWLTIIFDVFGIISTLILGSAHESLFILTIPPVVIFVGLLMIKKHFH